jgi:hypothetical protein
VSAKLLYYPNDSKLASESYPSGSASEIASRAPPNGKSKLKRPSAALNSANNKRLCMEETVSNDESTSNAAFTHGSRDGGLSSERLAQKVVVDSGVGGDLEDGCIV